MENVVIDVPTTSPTPKQEVPKEVKVLFGLPEAMSVISNGGKVTKEEWADEDFFVELKDNRLCLHKPDGLWHPWEISDGDFRGEDWRVL